MINQLSGRRVKINFKMDPALLKERAAFKKKSIAATEIKIAKPKPLSEAPSRPKPKKAKSKINKLLPNRRYKHLTGQNSEVTWIMELLITLLSMEVHVVSQVRLHPSNRVRTRI